MSEQIATETNAGGASGNKPPLAASGKRKAMKKRSKAWDHFTKFVNDAGEVRGKCNYCGNDLACDSKANGTTALNHHLTICKHKPPPEELKQSHLKFNVEDDQVGLVNWKFDQDSIRKALATMVVVDELPFNFVDGAGFKNFMLFAQPRFKMPSRWTIGRDCFSIYFDAKMKFKGYLEQQKTKGLPYY